MHTPASALPPQAHKGARAYQTIDAQSRSPLELVVMLYDGAIRFVRQAQEAHTRGDARRRGADVSRAIAIVGELRSTLDVERGREVAGELDRLYHYMTDRLLDVTTKGDAGGLEETLRLLATLREGWAEASAQAALTA